MLQHRCAWCGRKALSRAEDRRWQNVISSVQPSQGSKQISKRATLCASDADQLELAATDVNGDLIYAHWRDEAWINQTTICPSVPHPHWLHGKPTVVATAPGQLEIIVTGTRRWLVAFPPPERRLAGSGCCPTRCLCEFRRNAGSRPGCSGDWKQRVVVFVDGRIVCAH